MSAVIKVENLGKKYLVSQRGQSQSYRTLRDTLTEIVKSKPSRDVKEEFWALKNLSFEVKQGDRLGIIGRNGAGKSTLLKILSRITEPTIGRVGIKGRVASLLEVGTGFHPELTGRENIFLNGAIIGMTRNEIKKRFDEIVNFAEVEKFLDTPVKRYSSGMYMRLGFAVSAFLNTNILVVDEVLAVGDMVFQNKCINKMSEVSQNGRTILFVSHNMNAVKNLCNMGLFLNKEEQASYGEISEIISLYKKSSSTPDVAKFPHIYGIVVVYDFKMIQNDISNSHLEGDQNFEVRIDFELLESVSNFRIGIYLRSITGEVIFRSFLADWNPDLESLSKGRRSIGLNIPGKFLAKGNYIIELHASVYGKINYTGTNPLSLKFFIDNPVDFNKAHLGEDFDAYVINPNKWTVKE